MSVFASLKGNSPAAAPRPAPAPAPRPVAPQPAPRPAAPPPRQLAAPPSQQSAFANRQPAQAPQRPTGPQPVSGRGGPRGGGSVFSGAGKAQQASRDHNYHKLGNYVLRINRCKLGQKTVGNTAFVAIEATVIHVYQSRDPSDHRLGEDVTCYYDSTSLYFLRELKGFMIGVVPNMEEIIQNTVQQKFDTQDPSVYEQRGQALIPLSWEEALDKEWETAMFEMVGDGQPFAGLTVESSGTLKPNRKQPGKFYTVVRFKGQPSDTLHLIPGFDQRYLGAGQQAPEMPDEPPPSPPIEPDLMAPDDYGADLPF